MKLTEYTPRINVEELKALTCCPECYKTIHSAIMGIRGEDAKLRVLFLRDQLREHKKNNLDSALEKMFDDKLMEFDDVEEVIVEKKLKIVKGKKHGSKKETS
mgnify:CR=1 FL=1|tara:strand:+ start:267 stop:572 length:306 start_codon:yes stop_codon:yes gene_type:complete